MHYVKMNKNGMLIINSSVAYNVHQLGKSLNK